MTREGIIAKLVVMHFFFGIDDRKAFLKTLAGLCINLSAGWYGLVVIVPNFWPIKEFKDILVLTGNIFFGTLFLFFSFKLERKLL